MKVMHARVIFTIVSHFWCKYQLSLINDKLESSRTNKRNIQTLKKNRRKSKVSWPK